MLVNKICLRIASKPMIVSNGVEASRKNFNFTCSRLLIITVRKIYFMFEEQVLSKPLQTLSVDVYVIMLCLLANALTKSVCI